MKGAFVPLSVSYRENDRMLGVEPLAELVFVRGLAFSKEKFSDGFVSTRQLRHLAADLDRYGVDPEDIACQLVAVGLWSPVEDGWLIEGWADWNALDSSRAGSFGNHRRWHVQRGQIEDDCPYCTADDAHASGRIGGESVRSSPRFGGDSVGTSPRIANRVETEKNREERSSPAERREDVDALCDLLVELVTANGCKPPAVTKAWRDEARRLLDRDGVPLSEAERVMRWALNDTFWRSNVLSMPTFRKQYDRLKLQSSAKPNGAQPRVGINGRPTI